MDSNLKLSCRYGHKNITLQMIVSAVCCRADDNHIEALTMVDQFNTMLRSMEERYDSAMSCLTLLIS